MIDKLASCVEPSPTELFVASLAPCVAFHARRYLQRHDLPEDGLRVTTDTSMTSALAHITMTTSCGSTPVDPGAERGEEAHDGVRPADHDDPSCSNEDAGLA